MLWLLAYRISASRLYAWAAALIFATFPFSYESRRLRRIANPPLAALLAIADPLVLSASASSSQLTYSSRAAFYSKSPPLSHSCLAF